LQITQGGPIIAIQIENEYGSYGNDQQYLRYLENGLRVRGIDTLLFTSDGPDDTMLHYGTLPGILKTVNFGSHPVEAFAKLCEYQPDRPAMCMEFWNGWFDHWGETHHTRSAVDAAADLDAMLAAGASVNLYLFHGGTNFGFMNGANIDAGTYQSTVTSYDYDAPLNEAGDITPKYMAFREVLGRYAPQFPLPLPDPRPKMALGPVEMIESVTLFEALDTLSIPIRRSAPVPMECVGQNHGFVLYRTVITGSRENTLTIKEVHDRALVFVDGKPLATLDRQPGQSRVTLSTTARETRLDILVENMGRVNYGPEIDDRKGITRAVLFGQQTLFDWQIFPLPLDDLTALRFHTCMPVKEPAFYRARFAISEPQDTFLALPAGAAWTGTPAD
jgi:beta-galactosidase